MEEAEVKDILLSLVESNRNKPYYNDHIGNDVIGWRFPDEQSNANNEEYKMPVCQWSRVSCDVIDGSVTVLDLGDGFLMQSVLGGAAPTKEDEERAKNIGGARHLHERHLDALHEDRHLTPSDPTTTITIPSSLGKITSLRKIDLSSNQIQGTIPQSVTGEHLFFSLETDVLPASFNYRSCLIYN